jgi:hypothetical protein
MIGETLCILRNRMSCPSMRSLVITCSHSYTLNRSIVLCKVSSLYSPIRWGASQVQFFVLVCNEPFWLAHHQFFWNIEHSLKQKLIGSPLWPSFVDYVYESSTLGKAHEIKVWGYLGTSWGTYWEPRKQKSPPAPPKSQERKSRALLQMILSFFIVCMEILFLKEFSPFLAWANTLA